MRKVPKIICLCGSTKFKAAFEKANFEETLKGNIVLSVGCYMHHDSIPITPSQKLMLDNLHLKKIDLSDEILILNINGYIGYSTHNEIQYAKKKGKRIRFLEEETNLQ